MDSEDLAAFDFLVGAMAVFCFSASRGRHDRERLYSLLGNFRPRGLFLSFGSVKYLHDSDPPPQGAAIVLVSRNKPSMLEHIRIVGKHAEAQMVVR